MTAQTAVLLFYGETAIFASPEEAEAHVRACWAYPDEFVDADIHGADFLDAICDGENDEPWVWVEAQGNDWLAPDGTLWREGADGLARIVDA